MKLFIICLFTLSIYADIGTYLYTKNTRCIYDLHPSQNSNGFCYKYSNNPNTERCSTRAKLTHFIKGYDYNTSTGQCVLEHDLKLTGLDKDAYNNIMLFLSIVFSLIFFTTLFMLVF
jgi:hypothetical protein